MINDFRSRGNRQEESLCVETTLWNPYWTLCDLHWAFDIFQSIYHNALHLVDNLVRSFPFEPSLICVCRVLSSGVWRRVIQWNFSDVSEIRTASTCWVEEYTKKKTSKHFLSSPSCLSWTTLCPWMWSSTFLRNVDELPHYMAAHTIR